jgi:hypothetical protein
MARIFSLIVAFFAGRLFVSRTGHGAMVVIQDGDDPAGDADILAQLRL